MSIVRYIPRPRAVFALPVAAAALLWGAPASGASVPIQPIGHNQVFVGSTHGQLGRDKILMICAGPGSAGHPAGGQTVEVTRNSTTIGGFTGAKADSIVVMFPGPAAAPAITLHAYGVPAEIPTSLTLPCGVTATVRFVPVPAAKNSRPDLVTVAFDPGPGATTGR